MVFHRPTILIVLDINMLHILVVDDDERIRSLLKRYLQDNGFMVAIAEDIKQARMILSYFIFDLIVLDLMLPGEDGLSFTKNFKLQNTTPILMLSALGETSDKIDGLEIGADDYLVKPFEPRELLLRIKKLTERAVPTQRATNYIYFGEKKFNIANRSFSDQHDGDIPLTSLERNMIELMIKNTGKVLTRSDFMNVIGDKINERSIDVQIKRLRDKIEKNPSKPVYLQTIRGEGYILYARSKQEP